MMCWEHAVNHVTGDYCDDQVGLYTFPGWNKQLPEDDEEIEIQWINRTPQQMKQIINRIDPINGLVIANMPQPQNTHKNAWMALNYCFGSRTFSKRLMMIFARNYVIRMYVIDRKHNNPQLTLNEQYVNKYYKYMNGMISIFVLKSMLRWKCNLDLVPVYNCTVPNQANLNQAYASANTLLVYAKHWRMYTCIRKKVNPVAGNPAQRYFPYPSPLREQIILHHCNIYKFEIYQG